ncbi:RNA polymerase, sigma 54 subunit, RpoN/SigL [Desulfonispora thiosulfatigenes DSM 11270]|uniref:RNA polymerase, sigma 54 subunit, RpoN/SigL n=1 Tax=Desulfonispora thiosulfatigenes DSM 11270 TaxID=656914 RepID=A0A1W1VBQ3_DESTI|nr:RNA polymerase factor sigma-54 [Desulfonispora thiosulfatigenes]SMB90620.1 RNA polymerase, sigma 54 subunit, RpoN/SigL [Desulfonispora thiosulfatigenes DSM 11270]
MNFKQGLNITQNQKLIMTPELKQAINVLQLPIAELNSFIDQQLMENPVLEIADENQKAQKDNQKDEDKKNEVDWAEYFHDGRDFGFPKEKGDQVLFERFTTSDVTLKEYLEKQLSLYNLSMQEFRIAQYIIGNLDERGYFLCSFKDVANILNTSSEKVEETLSMIQDFEPLGIGARSLEECLEIQLKKKGLLTNELRFLIYNYLNDIGKGNLKKIAKDLGTCIETTQQMIDVIRNLNPKPGANYGSINGNRYIEPDVIVEKVGKEYYIIVNESNVPGLVINSFYKKILNEGTQDKKTESFIENNFNKAIWLIRSIEQRRATLYKVVSNLSEHQREFLEKGSKYLVPLTLKDVALQVNVHESTVSRVVANKYIQTPQGLFPLKHLFPGGLKNVQGENISATSIKKIIEDIVASENEKDPYSDSKLSELLKEKGLEVARRTVAKYREELGILVSSKRKRY